MTAIRRPNRDRGRVRIASPGTRTHEPTTNDAARTLARSRRAGAPGHTAVSDALRALQPEPPTRLHRQNLGGSVVWTWQGTTTFVEHEVRVDTHPLGCAYWTIRAGDTYATLPNLVQSGGPAAAEAFVTRLRASGADRMEANRWLARWGFQPTEHTGRADCNCADCPGEW